MKRNTKWKAALAAALLGAVISGPTESRAQNTGYVNGVVRVGTNTSRVGNWSNTSGWYYAGTRSSTVYDSRYGWVTSVYDGYSWTYYTYGYQLVLTWTGNGYAERAYRGAPSVAYPVIVGPHP